MKSKIDDLNFLTFSKVSKKNFFQIIERTSKAIVDSFDSEKAYSGLTPQELKKLIHIEDLLPEHGLGRDLLFEKLEKLILPNMLRTSSTDYMAHLHTLTLAETIAAELIIAVFNQSMDSWDQSPVATEIEIEVTKFLCKLYGYDEKAGGCFTSGGSQSNMTGLLIARDWFCKKNFAVDVKKNGLPPNYSKFRYYTSEISHFSMEKSCHLMGLGYDSVVKVPVNEKMKMDLVSLENLIKKDIDNGNIPVCIAATIGTTDYGSIDEVAPIKDICSKYGMWLHADAAYGGGVILSGKFASVIGDLSVCDSITVDFHKMFLMPISCSAILVKNEKNFDVFELHADYLNREEDELDGYTNLVGKSIQTTRRFDSLKVWCAFLFHGKDGYSSIMDTSMENSRYLYRQLKNDKDFEVFIEPEISSVVFRLKGSDEKNKKVRRKLIHQEGIVIGQTVYNGKVCLKFTLLNPLVDYEKLDYLIEKIRSIQMD
ncbi:MAG: pyridoxal phosphate-dependent decarboxylase family protein [Treponemataceae bacterium]